MCCHLKHGLTYIAFRKDWVLVSQDGYCCQIQDTLFCNLVQTDYFNWVKFHRPFCVSSEYKDLFPCKFLKHEYIQGWLFKKLHNWQTWLLIWTSLVTQGCHSFCTDLYRSYLYLSFWTQVPFCFPNCLFVFCLLFCCLTHFHTSTHLYFQSVNSKLPVLGSRIIFR